MKIEGKFFNVIILGFGFMFVLTAFQTCGMIQKVVLTSIHIDDNSYTGDGYTSLAIIYAVFAASNWLAPSVISFIGPKFAMLVGGITYGLFVGNFLYPVTWLLYFLSALIGVGAALIWTGQGNYLTINSDSETMARNSGVFWAMMQCSLFIGNLFVFFEFSGNRGKIDKDTRTTVFSVLLGICCCGLIFLLFLRGGRRQNSGSGDLTSPAGDSSGPVAAFVKSVNLLKTKDMLLLSATFFYSGIELSFFSGVYGTCIGFSDRIENAKMYMGVSGILIGAGEVIGGAAFGILGKKTNQYGRDVIVLLGYLIHTVTFYLIFINLPATSPIRANPDFAYIKISVIIALVCSFGLGFGDACFNTQLYSILGCMYPDDSCPAFALFKFVQAVAAAIGFGYSEHLKLPFQLLILIITATVGTFTFFIAEWNLYMSTEKKGKASINYS